MSGSTTPILIECPTCCGHGYIGDADCKDCSGTGRTAVVLASEIAALTDENEALTKRAEDDAQREDKDALRQRAEEAEAEVARMREWLTLSDERIDYIADVTARGMEDGIRGFCKVWGWRQFARALLGAAIDAARKETT